jgi:hypothetical protein
MLPWKKFSLAFGSPSCGVQHLRSVPSDVLRGSSPERSLIFGPGSVPVPSSKHESSR